MSIVIKHDTLDILIRICGFEVRLCAAWRDYGPLKRLRSCDHRSFYICMNMYIANCTCVLTLSYMYFVSSHRSSYCQATNCLHDDDHYYNYNY